jgi:hypothetical protein
MRTSGREHRHDTATGAMDGRRARCRRRLRAWRAGRARGSRRQPLLRRPPIVARRRGGGRRRSTACAASTSTSAPDLKSGHEPFRRIMAAVTALVPGEALVIRTQFEPAPLYDVLGRRGLAHWTERRADDAGRCGSTGRRRRRSPRLPTDRGPAAPSRSTCAAWSRRAPHGRSSRAPGDARCGRGAGGHP